MNKDAHRSEHSPRSNTDRTSKVLIEAYNAAMTKGGTVFLDDASMPVSMNVTKLLRDMPRASRGPLARHVHALRALKSDSEASAGLRLRLRLACRLRYIPEVGKI